VPIEFFDREAALEQASSDEGILSEVLNLFLDDLATWMTEIRDAVAQQDAKRLQSAAHDFPATPSKPPISDGSVRHGKSQVFRHPFKRTELPYVLWESGVTRDDGQDASKATFGACCHAGLADLAGRPGSGVSAQEGQAGDNGPVLIHRRRRVRERCRRPSSLGRV
jgi:hypothetical protein